MSTDIKLNKAKLSKIIQLGRLLGTLLGVGPFPGRLIKLVVPLAKNILVPLANVVSASVIDGAIQIKMLGRSAMRAGKEITLVILNEQLDDIIRIIKSLKNSGVLIDGVSQTIKQEIKWQKGRFRALLRNLGASLLGSMFIGKKS